MELSTRPLQERFGLEVLDVDLADLDEPRFDAIYRLWQAEPLDSAKPARSSSISNVSPW